MWETHHDDDDFTWIFSHQFRLLQDVNINMSDLGNVVDDDIIMIQDE